jgi:quercetin dioxygenase-like cupin family protein
MNKSIASMLLVAVGLGSAIESAWSGDSDIVLTPDKVQLADVPSYPGMKAATLMGNFSKPGTFVLRMKFPGNYVLGPHTHPDDRTITVLEGTWYSGSGDVTDCAKAAAMPVGSFGFIPGNAVHFDCTGPEGAYIQVTGIGPSGTKWLNPTDDPKIKYAK